MSKPAGRFAQQAQPDLSLTVSYIKVLPGQDDAYRTYLTTTAKKFYQEMMAANPSFLSWSAARVMYQGMEHGTDFDYVGAAIYAGPPPEPGANLDAISMKATGMSQADLARKLAAMRTIAGTEVLRLQAGARTAGVLKEGDFRIANRIKHPGKNYATYVLNARDYSDLQQRFIMQVVALVDRAR